MAKPGIEEGQLPLDDPGQDEVLVDDGASGDSPQKGDADVADEGPDAEAMAELFGELEGQEGHEAEGKPAQDGQPGGDDGDGGQSQEPGWDELPDDEKRKGYLRQQDYTKKTQAAAEERRELETYRRQLEAAALEIQQAQVRLTGQPAQQQAQQQQPQGQPMKLSDCLDELGQIDPVLLEQYEAQREAALEQRITEKHIKPVAEQLTAREKRESEATQLAEVDKLEQQKTQMEAVFPDMKDPAVLERVLTHMRDHQQVGSYDLRAAYVYLFPERYAEGFLRYKQAAAKRKQASGPERPPALPPGGRSRDLSEVPDVDDHEAMADAMEREFRQLTPK